MKYRRISLGLSMVMIVVFIFMVIGCTDEESGKKELTSDKYVFIDHFISINGEVIEGGPYSPYRYIDFPTYHFDAGTKTLKSLYIPEINGNLTAIYGDGRGLSGAAGSGADTWIYGVYSLPYSQKGLIINNISDNGTVNIFYKGQIIVLKPGDSWRNETSQVEQYGNSTIKIKNTILDMITNYGICNTTDIKKWQ